MAAMSSAQIVSAAALHGKPLLPNANNVAITGPESATRRALQQVSGRLLVLFWFDR